MGKDSLEAKVEAVTDPAADLARDLRIIRDLMAYDQDVLAAADRVEAALRDKDAEIARLTQELQNAQGDRDAYWGLHEVAAEWEQRAEAAERELARLREGLRPIIREYDLWAEDATDGEFRLWDLDKLVMAIVQARALLADSIHNPPPSDTPEDGAATCVESENCQNEWHYWRCPKHPDYSGAATSHQDLPGERFE